MSDARFHSIHLDFPRRHRYREQRDAALASRGALTLTAACALGFVAEAVDSSLLPGASFYLMDAEDHGAYALRAGANAIGRQTNNDIVIANRSVSRRHCIIVVHARGACELYDTASLNGTFVNGRRIAHAVQLASGDEIVLCRRCLRFLSRTDLLAAPPEDAAAEETTAV